MGSTHLLKTSLSPICVSQSTKTSFFCSKFTSLRGFKSSPCFKYVVHTRFSVCSKLQEGDRQSNGEEPTESLFMKELKRRGMTPTSLLEESNRIYVDDEIRFKDENGGFSNRNAVSTDLEKSLLNQRDRSMALNSEGLEGLFPRAKLLLSLGGTFFLAFWQLILLTVASFAAVYLYFGPSFVHDGKDHAALPQYIDPYALLEEDRISQAAPRLK